MLTYSTIRLNGELVDYEPSDIEQMIEDNCFLGDFSCDIWTGEELTDYYASWCEMAEGIWSGNPELLEPTETSRESVSSHQQNKTIKKTNKKKSMEQRAKQKTTHRIDAIPELDDE